MTEACWDTLTDIKEILNDTDPEFTDTRRVLAIRLILATLDSKAEQFGVR